MTHELEELARILGDQESSIRELAESSPETRSRLIDSLSGYSSEDTDSRNFVMSLWLLASRDNIAEINSVLPSGVRVQGRETEGGEMALSIDLISDYMPGQTYEKARSILRGLRIVKDPTFRQ